jgi:hypothetical protein
LGLSATSGLRAYLPLLAVGVDTLLFSPNSQCSQGQTDLVQLSKPFHDLFGGPSTPWYLVAILAVLAGGEFVVDKVPLLDHASDLVHTVIRPLAGAVVMAGISNPLSNWNPWAAAGVGAILALSVHGAKAATRPAVTATTAGIGNPVVSLIEDIAVVLLTVLSLLAPFLAVLFFVLMALLFFRAARGTWRWLSGSNRRTATVGAAAGVPPPPGGPYGPPSRPLGSGTSPNHPTWPGTP